MKYNIGESFTMKDNYNSLIVHETVTIVGREKKGKKTYLDVCNAEGKIFYGISFKLLKKKK